MGKLNFACEVLKTEVARNQLTTLRSIQKVAYGHKVKRSEQDDILSR